MSLISRQQFPIFRNHPNLVYLDTAASALVPDSVIAKMNEYYEEYSVNIHRGLYDLSIRASREYDAARGTVADFIHAKPEEIVFTSGATHGLNFLASVLADTMSEGDNIVLTRLEHHANLLPWQRLAKQKKTELRFIELTNDYSLDCDSAQKLIDERTKIVSVTMMSNALGTVVPVEKIVAMAKQVGATTIIDAAQGVAHRAIDVKNIDCDFLVFSGHKIYGPTGVGVLYGRREMLASLEPFFVGGDMVRIASYTDAAWTDAPQKFEAGTPPIAEVIGLGAAILFMQTIGFEYIQQQEHDLCVYAKNILEKEVTLIGPKEHINRSGVFSFVIDGIHPHDVADILGSKHIAVRAGHHCAMPLMEHLGLVGTARASFGVYTTKEDIDRLAEGIQEVKRIFRCAL
ncbi:MAG TPA: cysteine desulfurase [Candidatus Magasanikbacteria bacterium]|nr:MAG: hypothetical protein A3I74_05090 [Candidatus Magasanikbacteria bacterium RIFCSPLOWO2_02_FULL_47_16]OGH79786.1 MAG: hypothetical protein A3C10_04240 [Candidatus Magasanikbacteria bacterium RIFCSPHIGHO2_02_FULL_48_18]OGH82573.1 MAG: hypothetical protein A3G08_03925 [Candidatus Magasanikbacteria bacterium RIFCSPLOWO2_12_FULL_47_9b]HAZ29117.1 cysteine desulfurase [Candidatus Magasanikbacteria bacterium]